MSAPTIGSLAETLHATAKEQALSFALIHQYILDAYQLGRKEERTQQERKARLLAYVARDPGKGAPGVAAGITPPSRPSVWRRLWRLRNHRYCPW